MQITIGSNRNASFNNLKDHLFYVKERNERNVAPFALYKEGFRIGEAVRMMDRTAFYIRLFQPKRRNYITRNWRFKTVKPDVHVFVDMDMDSYYYVTQKDYLTQKGK